MNEEDQKLIEMLQEQQKQFNETLGRLAANGYVVEFNSSTFSPYDGTKTTKRLEVSVLKRIV